MVFDELATQLSSLKWQDYATIASILFGVVTLFAYIDQRRSSKGYEAILDIAKRNLDYEISQDKIKESREAIQKLDEHRNELTKLVKREIPSLARAAALREQAKVLSDSTAKNYSQWKKVTNELKEIPSEATIDQSVLDEVSSILVPEYERRTSKDTLRDQITIFSIGVVLLNNFLSNIFQIFRMPTEIIEIGNIFLAIFLASIGIRFFKLSFDGREVQKLRHQLYLFAYGSILAMGIIFSVIGLIATASGTIDERQIGVIFLAMGIMVITSGLLIYPRMKVYFK